jgi:hypothetical protein
MGVSLLLETRTLKSICYSCSVEIAASRSDRARIVHADITPFTSTQCAKLNSSSGPLSHA